MEHSKISHTQAGVPAVDTDVAAEQAIAAFLQQGFVSNELVQPNSSFSQAALPESETTSAEKVSFGSMKKKIAAQASGIFSNWGFGEQAALQANVIEFLNTVSEEQIKTFVERSLRPVTEWGYRDRDPVARGICRAVVPGIFSSDSTMTGLENLERASGRPIIFLGNHLAALDVHALDTMLVKHGRGDIADRLTAVVGHKTFEYPVLRQASLAFGTLQVPQSMSVSARSKLMSARELALGSRAVIEAAHARIEAGDHLVIFPEGTRSRTGQMYSLLPAIARYIRDADAVIVPFGQHGIEKILPADSYHFTKGTVSFALGKPVETDLLQQKAKGVDRQLTLMNTVGYLISGLLPSEYQGRYSHLNAIASDDRSFQIARELA